jgi:uncharacterized protein (TIGR02996 family)
MRRKLSSARKEIAMNSDSEWQKALKTTPDDNVLRLAYADWLEERGERLKALLNRQKAGAGTLIFSVWHPSWGEKRSNVWTVLSHLKSHIRQHTSGRTYHGKHGDVPLKELVVIVEWTAEVTRLAYHPDLTI